METNDSFSHVIGNQQTVDNLRMITLGYQNLSSESKYRQHFAFVGPPGSGKTTVAKALAKGLKLPLVKEISAVKGMTLDPVFDYCRNHCPRVGQWVLIIDEFHILSVDNQSRLLTVLEKDGTYTTNKGDVWRFPGLILIVATTEEKQFFIPGLARRFNWQYMEIPDIEDCILIVKNECESRKIGLEYDLISELCRIHNQNPGEAIAALNSVELMLGSSIKVDLDSISKAVWRDPESGLDATQQKYMLTVLKLKKANNPPTLARIAASMKLRMTTIQGIEASLSDYVVVTGRGRTFTDEGNNLAKLLEENSNGI